MSEQNFKEILRNRDLFLLDVEKKGMFLLYAPLADCITPVSKKDAQNLAEAIINPGHSDKATIETASTLCDVIPVALRQGHVRNEKDFINLSILPNNICNFSCSYCYSAKGRSSQCLDLGQIKKMIDYFLDRNRNSSELLTISIFGGGEPLLSWEKTVRDSIEYIYSNCGKDRNVVTTLITNGSLIPNGFTETCKHYNINLVCSYEILRDVQDIQRKHYDLVSGNIAALISEGVVPAINSVITPLNVGRQEEMIATLADMFPLIRHVAFEPVINGDINDKESFYKDFAVNFLKAEALATEKEICLTCTALRNVDVTVDRYCAGELALCADGSISICPCVSSPKEPNYNSYIYGQVDDNGVHINHDKLQKLLARNVHSQPWCRDCFAKWNCGGGCINNTICNHSMQDTAYCRFTRNFLKYILTSRLDKVWIEETGMSITELIGNYERFITE